MNRARAAIAASLVVFAGCARHAKTPEAVARPSILLVTLDTTRADAIGPEQRNVDTPSFNALAARARRYRFAYCAVPQTLASHTTILTGLYPAGHGIHENGRYLDEKTPVIAQQLKNAGYRTAAFVSAFAVARRFGLARGFDLYDDDFGSAAERRAADTTDRALRYLAGGGGAPLFMWVHYYDPHFPYDPPEPFRTQYARQPYFGEVAYMDQQFGRLIAAWDKLPGPKAVIVVADHGEGLGDHGEAQHGDLLYQATVHVPLLVLGPGVPSGVDDTPISTRHVYDIILELSGGQSPSDIHEVVLGEAMKPFLDYGWQPQVMAVDGRQKSILAGRAETYDVVADPGEMHDLANVTRAARAALRDYPIPSADAAQLPPDATEEERRKLASLGYINSGTKPVIRADAPRPADMTSLFPVLDRAAQLFAAEQYAAAIPLLKKILARDPHNLDAALRLATSYSSLGRDQEAVAAFATASAIAPNSQDVRTYLGLHYARGKQWPKAIPLLESVIREAPDRLPALEALAMLRERQGDLQAAVALREKIYSMRSASASERAHLGAMQMALGETDAAIRSFEQTSGHDLELGVLYLAARRYQDAAAALDRVPPGSPAYAMASFKRAQVSVLLHEADAASRIANARQHADATTRPLIERERLFR